MSLCYRDEAEIPPHVPAPPPGCCPECVPFARWVKRVGLDWRCPGCESLLLAPPFEPAAARPTNPWRALDLLANWTGYIDGSAIPLFAPAHYEDEHASGTTGRATSLAGSGAAFAAMIDHTIASDGSLSTHASRVASDGRPDDVDDRSDEFRIAVDALRTLDAMVHAGRPEDALVIAYAGWWLGSAAQSFWRNADEDAAVYGLEASARFRTRLAERWAALEQTDHDPEPRARERLGLDWRIGHVFADAFRREQWLKGGPVGRGFAQLAGKSRLESAVAAWEAASASPGAPSGHRVSLASLRATLTSLVRAADADLGLWLKPRVAKRRRDAGERLKAAQQARPAEAA